MLAERLQEIAREGTSDKRRQLLRELTDLFFDQDEARSEAENGLYGEIATRISGEMSVEDRSEFAERIADESTAPRNLVVTLGNDDIRVARPVIERSTVLTDDDLCSIVEKRGEEHRIAVTTRPAISESVSAALVRHGGEQVHVRLANHGNAAMAPEVRQKLQAAVVPKQQAPSQASFAASLVAQEVLKRIKQGQTTLDIELRHMAERDMSQIIGHLLAQMTQLKSEIAIRTVVNGREEALMMLLRAAGASFEAFARFTPCRPSC